MTIRRDLDRLVEAGDAQRVHGGARAPERLHAPSLSSEPSFELKVGRQRGEKLAIAEAAAATVKSGSAIALTGGTTTATLASFLSAIADLIIITNSLAVASRLHESPGRNHTLLLTGGEPTASAAMVGPIAERSLEAMHIDQLFMGVHGMSNEAGYTTPNILEARTNQAFIKAAANVVVLADSSKWATVGLTSIAPLAQADTVITDDQLAPEARAALEGQVGSLVIAPTS